MTIELTGKTAEMIKELAISQGMTDDETVMRILEWYFEDCAVEK